MQSPTHPILESVWIKHSVLVRVHTAYSILSSTMSPCPPHLHNIQYDLGIGQPWLSILTNISTHRLYCTIHHNDALPATLPYFSSSCLRGRFLTLRCSTVLHNDPAAHKDHCGICEIRTRDSAHRGLGFLLYYLYCITV